MDTTRLNVISCDGTDSCIHGNDGHCVEQPITKQGAVQAAQGTDNLQDHQLGMAQMHRRGCGNQGGGGGGKLAGPQLAVCYLRSMHIGALHHNMAALSKVCVTWLTRKIAAKVKARVISTTHKVHNSVKIFARDGTGFQYLDVAPGGP